MNHFFPKIIWQTHNYKKEDLPEFLSYIAGTWKNLNPEWEHRYVDHEQRDEMVRVYPEIYKVYKNQKPSFQSDIWRFLVTYEHGGCYADMDSVCIKPLDYLLKGIDPLIQMVTVPIYKRNGNTHNYVTKKKSQPMLKVFNQMITYPESIAVWGAWNIFTENVYADETVSQSFIVKNEENLIENVAAIHDIEYKFKFEPNAHTINYYGQMINYLDFIKQNGLSLAL